MKKLGLALGAGGSRGVAHIGFLQALEEQKIKPSYIAGSSIGAVVGASYASGITPKELLAIVKDLRVGDFASPSMKRGGLFSTRRMRTLLKKHIGDIDFSALKIPFRCVAVDMKTQSLVLFDEGSVLDGVVASASIPAIFRPLEKGGMRLVDGGVLERVPVVEVKEMGADVVVAVDVLGRLPCQEECPNAFATLLEMIDLMDNYRIEHRKREYAKKVDFWLEPKLGDMNKFDLKGIRFAYERGYEIGAEYAPEIKKALKE